MGGTTTRKTTSRLDNSPCSQERVVGNCRLGLSLEQRKRAGSGNGTKSVEVRLGHAEWHIPQLIQDQHLGNVLEVFVVESPSSNSFGDHTLMKEVSTPHIVTYSQHRPCRNARHLNAHDEA